MGGVILENLSGRKLICLVSTLLCLQILCFLLGALIAPAPSSVETVLATKCLDDGKNQGELFQVRGKNRCHSVNFYDFVTATEDVRFTDQIVFAFQLPSPRDKTVLDYSRWQQNLISILQFDISYHASASAHVDVPITMDVTLAVRNRYEDNDTWSIYAVSQIQRRLECSTETTKPGYLYNCSLVPLFELGSLYYDFYLINIRFPSSEGMSLNNGLGRIEDLWLICINQNGGFTKVWLALKCMFLPLVIATLIWFWNRLSQLPRPLVLLEYMLLLLGGTIVFLNLPVEFFTLFYDAAFMPLFQDIRQGMFYASLLSFWLVFTGEHLMIHDPRPHRIKLYWKHLSAVIIGCLCLLLYDTCEKGAQIFDPFYSIWVTDFTTKFAIIFLGGAVTSAAVYFAFLCYMMFEVLKNINAKRASLPNMPAFRRMHYEGVIYRFKFLMLTTITCAALTIIGFLLGHMSEGRWKWDENFELEYTSGFFTAVYGMWNLYTLALLILYCPSHKQWPSENNPISEEIEFNNFPRTSNEMSLLTFATKMSSE